MTAKLFQLVCLALVVFDVVTARPQEEEEQEQKDYNEEEDVVETQPGKAGDRHFGLVFPDYKKMENNQSSPIEYFNSKATDIPASYSAVEKGLVSPVKDQGNCGASAAFASIAVYETCVMRATGYMQSYSEQQLLDCAKDNDRVNGCKGAPAHAYLDWAATLDSPLALTEDYPYTNFDNSDNHACSSKTDLEQDDQVVINSTIYNIRGNEEQLKRMVFDFGAVVAGLEFSNETAAKLKAYDGKSIFWCTESDKVVPDDGHAVTVVGYGTEQGRDYWLIKNSWGESWGNKGFMKLIRGEEACHIGEQVATIDCQPLDYV